MVQGRTSIRTCFGCRGRTPDGLGGKIQPGEGLWGRMKAAIFLPVLIAVFLGVRAGNETSETNQATVNFCFGQNECSLWNGASLLRRTFIISKDGTHILVKMSEFTFTNIHNNKREFGESDSEERLSACEIYDANNWTCHAAADTTVDWNISLRDGKFTNPGYFITGPDVWGPEFTLYRWFGEFALPRATS